MAQQQEVDADIIEHVVKAAASRNSPVALTVRHDELWQSYRSRFLGLRGNQVWIEFATPNSPRALPPLEVGQKVGITFKQRHYKFVFTTILVEMAEFTPAPDVCVHGMQIAWPHRMFQLQRRMFQRVDVPGHRWAFVHFWEGGLGQEPQEELRDKLTYTGQLVDISAGGFRVRMLGTSDPGFQTGDPLGCKLTVQGLNGNLRADGMFRHTTTDEFGVTLGIQFLGLTETSEGRVTLDQIARLLRDFHNAHRRRSRKAPSAKSSRGSAKGR